MSLYDSLGNPTAIFEFSFSFYLYVSASSSDDCNGSDGASRARYFNGSGIMAVPWTPYFYQRLLACICTYSSRMFFLFLSRVFFQP